MSTPKRDLYADFLVRKHAKAKGVPEEEAIAIAEQETGFRGLDPGSISGAGARGTMQVMRGTGLRHVTPERFDTVDGQIEAGVSEYARLRAKYGPRSAYVGYHGGEGAIKNPSKSYDRHAKINSGEYASQVEARVEKEQQGQQQSSQPDLYEQFKAKQGQSSPAAPVRPNAIALGRTQLSDGGSAFAPSASSPPPQEMTTALRRPVSRMPDRTAAGKWRMPERTGQKQRPRLPVDPDTQARINDLSLNTARELNPSMTPQQERNIGVDIRAGKIQQTGKYPGLPDVPAFQEKQHVRNAQEEEDWQAHLATLRQTRPEYRQAEADEIAKTRELTVEEREALQLDTIGNQWKQLPYSVASGVGGFLGGAAEYAGAALSALPSDDAIDFSRIGPKVETAGRETREKAEYVGRAAGLAPGMERDLAQGFGTSLPSFALGGAGKAGKVGMTVLGMLAQAGQSYTDAKQSGATSDEALLAGGLNAPSGLLELWGVGGTLSRVARRKAAKDLALAILKEGGEEAALNEIPQQIWSDLVAKGVYDADRDVFSKDLGYTGLVAFLLGGGMGGGAHVAGRVAEGKRGGHKHDVGRRIRHEDFGEGTVDSSQVGVRKGFRRVIFDNPERGTKEIVVPGLNRKAQFIRGEAEGEVRAEGEIAVEPGLVGQSAASGDSTATVPIDERRVAEGRPPSGLPERRGLGERAGHFIARTVFPKGETDALTGLQHGSNWKRAKDRIDADPTREVAILDANDLKKINDTTGSHATGDKYLADIGRIIAEEAKAAGISPRETFRTGEGDEFAIAGSKGALAPIVERIKQRVAELQYGDIRPSISGGVGEDSKAADTAMYADKKAFKDKRPGTVHKFSSTQVNLPKPDTDAVLALGQSIPDEDLAGDGREKTPHITVKYGLHSADAEAELRALLADRAPVTATLGKTTAFEGVEDGTADAVVAEADSPGLRELNKIIADALPNTDTHPEYKPHATIAYVKPGKGKEYSGDNTLAGREITVSEITFSGKDGKEVTIPLGGRGTTSRTADTVPAGETTTPVTGVGGTPDNVTTEVAQPSAINEPTKGEAEGAEPVIRPKEAATAKPEAEPARERTPEETRQSLYDKLAATRRAGGRTSLFQESDRGIRETSQTEANVQQVSQPASAESATLPGVPRGEHAENAPTARGTDPRTAGEVKREGIRERVSTSGQADTSTVRDTELRDREASTEASRGLQQTARGDVDLSSASSGATLLQADSDPDPARPVVDEIISTFVAEGIVDFRTAATRFASEMGNAGDFGDVFERSWDAMKGRGLVKNRGKVGYDKAVATPERKRETLTSAVIRNGRLNSTGLGEGEQRAISPKEGGRIGLFSDKGLPVEDMIRTLQGEGWNFFDADGGEDLDAFYAALRDEVAGNPHYSSLDLDTQAEEEWKQAGRNEFASNSDHSIMSRAFTNADNDPDYTTWQRSYDAALDPRHTPDDDDIQSFKELSSDLGISDETVNRLLRDATDGRRAEKDRAEGAERSREGQGRSGSQRQADFRQALVDVWGADEALAHATAVIVGAMDSLYGRITGRGPGGIFDTLRVGGRGVAGEPGVAEIEQEGSARAIAQFLSDGTAIIRPLVNPNESSIAHEAMHVAVARFMDLAQRLQGEVARSMSLARRAEAISVTEEGRELIKHMRNLAQWAGFASVDEFVALHDKFINSTLAGSVLDRYVNGQEKIARGFERYLRTGRAPTPRLQPVFDMFRKWLKKIYKSVPGSEIDVDISKQARKAMDFLLGGDGKFEPPAATGIANAVVTQERLDMGLEEVASALRVSFGASLDAGKALVDGDSTFREDVFKWSEKGQVLTDAQDAALAYDRMKLYNEHRTALRLFEEASKDGNEAEMEKSEARMLAVEELININDLAAKKTGTENGRALNARKILIRQDYSLETMLQRARVANGGVEVDAETRARIFEMAAKIEELESEIDKQRTIIGEQQSILARQEKAGNWGRAMRSSKGASRPRTAVSADMERVKAEFAKLARATKQAAGLEQRDRGGRSGQTDTPEFKKWFGESKVVDEDGNPLTVYHGTSSDFAEFNEGFTYPVGRSGVTVTRAGIFFTDSTEDASRFSNLHVDESKEGQGQQVVAAYLSLENPLVVEGDGEPFDHTKMEAYIRSAQKRGKDGLIYRDIQNYGESELSTTYVVFKPTQIKSATGNKGTFDAGSPNILEQADTVRPGDPDPADLDSSDPGDLLSPELRSLIKQFARLSVEAGARTGEEVNDQVYGMVSEHFPSLSARQVADIWSDYGKKSEMSKDEIDMAVREAKRQQRLITSLEEAKAGEAPKRSGLQRDKPSRRVRELTRAVTDALRKAGINIRQPIDPDEQWKTTQEGIRTRLRNEIEDLNNQLETGEKPPTPAKLAKIYEPETIELMVERDILKKQLEDPVAEGKEKLRKRIEEVERKLREGDTARAVKPVVGIHDDAESVNLRNQLKKLQAQLAAIRDLPRQQERLQTQILDLQRRIRERDFSRTAREAKAANPILAPLTAQRDELRKILGEMEGPRQLTHEQRVKAAEKATEKAIEEIEKKIAAGNVHSTARTSSLWSEQLGQLKKRQAALSDTLKEMRKATKVKPDPLIAHLKAYGKRLEKATAEYERRLRDGDFTTTVRAKTPLDAKTEALVAARDRAKANFEREKLKHRPGKWWRNITGLGKAWMLSDPNTQLTNIVGTGGYQAFIEVSRIPAVLWDIAAESVSHRRSISGPSPSAIWSQIIQMRTEGMKEFKEIWKNGATAEQMAKLQIHDEISRGFNLSKDAHPVWKTANAGVKGIAIASNAIFRLMSGSDRFWFQGAFKRNLIDRATVQAKNERRLDKDLNIKQRVKDIVDSTAEGSDLWGAAVHDALISTFNNNNRLSDRIKRFRSPVNKEGASTVENEKLNALENALVDLIIPFDRTPTNVIMRVLEATPIGLGVIAPVQAAKWAREVWKNLANSTSSLSPESQAERLKRQDQLQRNMVWTLGKGTTGSLGIMAFGYLMAAAGLATGAGDDEDRKNGIEPNSIYAFGRWWPVGNLAPVGTIFSMGAGLYTETHREKGTAGKIMSVGVEPLANQPLLSGPGRAHDVMKNPDRGGAQYVSGQVFSRAVPFSGAVRRMSKLTDSEGAPIITPVVKRKAEKKLNPTGLKEQFQTNVPFYRKKLERMPRPGEPQPPQPPKAPSAPKPPKTTP